EDEISGSGGDLPGSTVRVVAVAGGGYGPAGHDTRAGARADGSDAARGPPDDHQCAARRPDARLRHAAAAQGQRPRRDRVVRHHRRLRRLDRPRTGDQPLAQAQQRPPRLPRLLADRQEQRPAAGQGARRVRGQAGLQPHAHRGGRAARVPAAVLHERCDRRGQLQPVRHRSGQRRRLQRPDRGRRRRPVRRHDAPQHPRPDPGDRHEEDDHGPPVRPRLLQRRVDPLPQLRVLRRVHRGHRAQHLRACPRRRAVRQRRRPGRLGARVDLHVRQREDRAGPQADPGPHPRAEGRLRRTRRRRGQPGGPRGVPPGRGREQHLRRLSDELPASGPPRVQPAVGLAGRGLQQRGAGPGPQRPQARREQGAAPRRPWPRDLARRRAARLGQRAHQLSGARLPVHGAPWAPHPRSRRPAV
ncbi:MAG: hypothetical protein AVDCRST_MAG53-1929, partial [uncultured Solirubrobacteraceae bacterium]